MPSTAGRMAQNRRANSSGQDPAFRLHLVEMGHSFEDNNVHVLAKKKDSWTKSWSGCVYVTIFQPATMLIPPQHHTMTWTIHPFNNAIYHQRPTTTAFSKPAQNIPVHIELKKPLGYEAFRAFYQTEWTQILHEVFVKVWVLFKVIRSIWTVMCAFIMFMWPTTHIQEETSDFPHLTQKDKGECECNSVTSITSDETLH